jgi:glucokinase
MIVLGGVVARYGGDGFVQAIRERMQLYMPLPVERSVSIVASTLGSESVVLGGVALALESMRE